MNPPAQPPRQPAPTALLYCLFNWLLPGSGYLAAKDIRRGWALFLLINGCFLLGLAFDGTIVVPSLNPGSTSFNIVALLTFLVEIWHAGGTMVVLLAERIGGPGLGLLARDPGAAYSDLGSFHFLVAAGLNYFATVRLYDLLAGDPGTGTGQEGGQDGSETGRAIVDAAEAVSSE